MGFRNSIASGYTLVREALQSLGFVSGVSGWQIKRDGTAEFSNTISRGTWEVTGPNGQKIVIEPGSVFPQIRFTSADGTKEGYINAAADTSSPDKAWLGLNCSPVVGSDAVERYSRVWLLGDTARMEVIRKSDQQFEGGSVILDKDNAHLLHDSPTTNQARITVGKTTMTMTSNGSIVITSNGNIEFHTPNDFSAAQFKRDSRTLMTPVSEDGFSTPAVTALFGNDTCTNPNYEDMTSDYPTGFTFQKLYDDTRLVPEMFWTGYTTVGGTDLEFAINIDGTDYDIGGLGSSVGTDRLHYYGWANPIIGLAHGPRVVQARWRRPSGTGVLTRDTKDRLGIRVREIKAAGS